MIEGSEWKVSATRINHTSAPTPAELRNLRLLIYCTQQSKLQLYKSFAAEQPRKVNQYSGLPIRAPVPLVSSRRECGSDSFPINNRRCFTPSDYTTTGRERLGRSLY